MFGSRNVYAMVRDVRVKVQQKEQDTTHTVEVKFELPLTYDLAEEILPVMARDLFRKVKSEMIPAPEIGEASFLLPMDPMNLELRSHPDLEGEAKIQGVQVKQVWATKATSGGFLLSFVVFFPLSDEAAMILLIRRIKLGVYCTFEVQEPRLPMDTTPAEPATVEASHEPVDQPLPTEPEPAQDEPEDPQDQAGNVEGAHERTSTGLKVVPPRRGRPRRQLPETTVQ